MEISPESRFVQNARQKLKKQIENNNRLITPEALKRITAEIHTWISVNAKHRVTLKEKNISLFDGNEHIAKITNQYVKQLQQNLENE